MDNNIDLDLVRQEVFEQAEAQKEFYKGILKKHGFPVPENFDEIAGVAALTTLQEIFDESPELSEIFGVVLLFLVKPEVEVEEEEESLDGYSADDLNFLGNALT